MKSFEHEPSRPYTPEVGTFAFYIEELDKSTLFLVIAAANFIEAPTSDQFERVQQSAKGLYINFCKTILSILDSDMTYFEKIRATLTLQKSENQRRVNDLNAILGEETLEPAEFIRSDLNFFTDKLIDEGLSGSVPQQIDITKWYESEAACFGGKLAADLNNFARHRIAAIH